MSAWPLMYVASAGESGSAFLPLTITRNGALRPGPKPASVISAALRWVESTFAVLSFGSDSCRFSAGRVSAANASITTAIEIPGKRYTKLIHRLARPRFRAPSSTRWRSPRVFSPSTRTARLRPAGPPVKYPCAESSPTRAEAY